MTTDTEGPLWRSTCSESVSPGWKLAGRFGATLVYRVDVLHDPEAGVYVATSPDLRGLVAEAATLDDLFREVHAGADELIREQVMPARPANIRAAWGDVAASEIA